MSTKIGRVEVTSDFSSWDQTGDDVTAAIQVKGPTVGEAKWAARTLAGYDLNVDEPVIPVTSSVWPETDGFFEVVSVKVSPVGTPDQGVFDVDLRLKRVAGWALPVIDYVTEHGQRDDYNVAAGTCRALIGWPAAAVFEAADSEGPTVTELTRSGDDGDVSCVHWAADGPQWPWRVIQVLPEYWNVGACEILEGPPLVAPPVVDTFERSDSATVIGTADTGQTWSKVGLTGDGDMGISSGALYASTPDSAFQYATTGEAGPTDGYFEATIDNTGAAGSTGFGYRADFGGLDLMFLLFSGDQITLSKIDAGIPVNTLGSASIGSGVTVDIRVEFVGDQHRVYVDGVLVIEGTDGTAAGDGYGIVINNTSSRVHAYEIGHRRTLDGAETDAGTIDEQLAAYRPVVGRQITANKGWCLTNHHVRCYPDLVETGVLAAQWWGGSDWTPAKRFAFGRGIPGITPEPASPTNDFQSATITRNDPVDGVSLAVLTESEAGHAFATLSLQRGQRLIFGQLTSGFTDPAAADAVFYVRADDGEAHTAITAGNRATNNDANGDRYVVVSAAYTTTDGADALMTQDFDDTDFLDFGLGLALGGDSATTGNTVTDLMNQYGAWVGIHTVVTTL